MMTDTTISDTNLESLEKEVARLRDEFFQCINLRQIDHCHALSQQLTTLTLNHPPLRAWACFVQGILVFEAHNNWSQAEQIFLELFNDNIATDLRMRALYALGRTAIMQGRWQHAIAYFEQLGALATEVAQRLDQVKAWRQIAICYCKGYTQGDFGELDLRKGIVYVHMALALLPTGETEQIPPSIIWLTGTLWSTLGNLHRHLQQWDEANKWYLLDLSVCQQLDDQHGMGVSYLNLGEICHKRGREEWQIAQSHFQHGRAIFRQFSNRHLEIDTLINQGALALDMQKPLRARNYYRRAIRLIERLRTSSSAEEGRAGFFTTVVNCYGALIKLYIEMGETVRAFNLVERARSRSFLELLANQAIRTPSQIPQSLVEEEESLRSQLQQFYTATGEANEKAGESIHLLESALDQLLRRMRLIHSEYVDLRAVRPLRHHQIVRRLTSREALISYFMAGDEIFAFVITPQQSTVHRLPLLHQELRRAFDQQGYILHTIPDRTNRLTTPWLLQALYARLIQPLNAHLQGIERLYIVASNMLHFVPFHALCYRTPDNESRSLIDDYQIVHAPSATVLLQFCRKKRQLAAKGVLAIGYDGSGYDGEPLIHAEAEAKAIVKLATEGLALTGEDALTETLFTKARDHQWLHFSCHGQFNVQSPLLSFLQLANARLYVSDILKRLQLQADLVTLSACETGRNQVLNGDELMGMVRAFIYAGSASVLVTLWPVDELSTRIMMEAFYRNLLNGFSKCEALRMAQHQLRNLSATEVIGILTAYGESKPEERVKHLIELSLPSQTSTHYVSTHQLPDRATATDATSSKVFAHPYFWASFILIGDAG